MQKSDIMPEPAAQPRSDTPKDQNIGLIGVGIMGRGIARNLAQAGFTVHALDTQPQAVGDLAPYGVKPAVDLSHLVADCRTVITCLPTQAAVEQVYLGDEGLLSLADIPTDFIDCSSTDPALARTIGARAEAAGHQLMDAPMLLGGKAAWEGTVTLIVGGPAEVIARCTPVLAAFSAKQIHAGGLGSAHEIKAINNAVTLANHTILSEAFSVAMSSGIDLKTLVEVMQSSMANSSKLHDLSARVLNDNYEKTISFVTASKDAANFVRIAERLGARADVSKAVLGSLTDMGRAGDPTDTITRMAERLMSCRVDPVKDG